MREPQGWHDLPGRGTASYPGLREPQSSGMSREDLRPALPHQIGAKRGLKAREPRVSRENGMICQGEAQPRIPDCVNRRKVA